MSQKRGPGHPESSTFRPPGTKREKETANDYDSGNSLGGEKRGDRFPLRLSATGGIRMTGKTDDSSIANRQRIIRGAVKSSVS